MDAVGTLLRLIWELGVYLVTVVPDLLPIILALAAPLALGALCGVMNERSGVVNIGIEGMMLASAFAGWFVASLVTQAVPAVPSAFFGVTPGLLVGLVAAVLTGMAVSAIHAWLSI